MKGFFVRTAVTALPLVIAAALTGCQAMIMPFWTGHTMIENSRLYLVSGSIVDDQGHPLEQVTLEITVHNLRATPDADEFASSTKYQMTANRTFQIGKRGRAITVQFNKEGYYPQVHHFGTSPYGTPPNARRFENLTVVLEKQGQLTGLREMHGRMEYQVAGRGSVVDFDRKNNPPFRWVDDAHDPD